MWLKIKQSNLTVIIMGQLIFLSRCQKTSILYKYTSSLKIKLWWLYIIINFHPEVILKDLLTEKNQLVKIYSANYV